MMRLLSLRLAAIGPFPGEHHIDLEALGAGGLFLLEGPTGSGKSTLIDAIVFALYGRPAAQEASVDRLPSRLAAPGARPSVTLVFETAAGLFRVQRSPEHRRPKLRGTGVTTEPAGVRLWRLTDPGDECGIVLSTRVGEADAEIQRIVGLTRDQFVQTVVLPQGEFAAFLRATPEDRRAVLQRIFGTEIYQRVQDTLAEGARSARRRAEQARVGVGSAIEAFVRAARAAAPGGSATPDDDPAAAVLAGRLEQLEEMAAEPEEAKVRAVVGEVTDSLALVVEDRSRDESGARALDVAARDALDAGRGLAERLARRADLLAERERLAAREADILAAGTRLATARRSANLAGTLRAAAAGRGGLEAARIRLAAVVAALREGPDADLAGLDTEGASAARCAALRERGALDPLLALEGALPTRAATAAAHRAHLEATRAKRKEAATVLGARPTERAALEAARAVIHSRAGRADALALEVQAAKAVARAAQQAADLTRRDAAARDALHRATQTADAAVGVEADVRRRRLTGIAGELAAGLEPDAPCPVCGATDHPEPAAPAAGAATDAEVHAAEEARASAEAGVLRAAQDAADVAARLAAAREASDGLPAAPAAERVEDLQGELAAARSAAADLPAQDERLAAFDTATERARAVLAALEAEDAAATERLGAAEATLEADRAAVAGARGDHSSVAARARALADRAEAAERLEAARREVAGAEATVEDQAGLLAQALVEAGFETEREAQAAALDARAMDALDARIAAHRTQTARVAAELSSSELADLGADCPVPDIAALTARHEAASRAHVHATREAERARTHHSTVTACGDTLDERLAEDAGAAAAAAPVLRLADLATAGESNPRRVTLATYVLLRRFEDVVAAANSRLAAMSGGRYSLARTDSREGGVGARKAGLCLVIEDHLTGDERNPRTLSGGETFYVSLSLALGLADVVTAESGGIDVGTLLIDEGFGSLDSDTLDDVLGELGRLRDRGRVVGLVSHVADLKQRVSERIEVRRRPDGSSTLTVVA